MTRKGVAAVDVASMVGVVLSEELPGMLRRRPVLSGGDSEKQREIFKCNRSTLWIESLEEDRYCLVERLQEGENIQ